MKVICDNCKAKLNIPDHKIPKDKTTTLNCPKCKEKIKIPVMKQSKPTSDFALENKFNSLALVCIGDKDLQKKVYSITKRMGFNTQAETTTQQALKKLQYHIYPLVIIDEAFDNSKGLKGIIDKLNSVDMSLRRKICLVLITRQFKTNDNMSALHSSVNSIINQDDATHLENLLPEVLKEHKDFYTIYNASLKLIGRG
jgi:hypothetical protein